MTKRIILMSVFLCVALMFIACGGGKSAQKPSADSVSASQPAAQPVASKAVSTSSKSGWSKISDIADEWNRLYHKNEAVINKYEGMPIMGLVTPATTFIATVQFDMLNLGNKEGRFEGKLMLAGYKGFVEKSGAKITFGYDDKLEKNGFGPTAKAGDRVVANGSLALDQDYYIAESYTERAGKKITRSYSEFKRLGDGSMICLALDGHAIDMRGEQNLRDEVIYLHNGKDQYDFVIAQAKTGPEFKSISFADKGDLTKEQAIELFKNAGYAVEKTGGIKDGKLVVDK